MYLSDLHKIFAMLSMSVARSFSDSVAIRNVLPFYERRHVCIYSGQVQATR